MELISILLSTYNEPIKMIEESITSILNQTYKNIELILINDNAQNRELDKLLSNYEKKDCRIKYIKHNANMGLVKSLNEGLQYAKGNYIARMDADDISVNDRLENQLKYIKDTNYDMIGGNIIKIDEYKNKIGELKVPSEFEKIKKYQIYGSCILHPTWFVKKEVYETLNGYREIYACEDYDFILRAILKGYKVGNIDKTVLFYRIRGNSISNSSYCHQKILTYYLADFYKKNESPSENIIKQYIKSETYNIQVKKLEKYIDTKIKIKSKKYFYIVQLFINPYFYKNIVEHYIQNKRLK